MIVNIKLSLAKRLFKETKLIKGDWRISSKLSTPASVMDDIEIFKMNLAELEVVEVKSLYFKVRALAPKSVVDKITRYIEATENPEKEVLKTLDAFKAALTGYIMQQKTKWFWRTGQDGVLLPYLATSVENVPAKRDSPRHIALKLVYGAIGDGQGTTSSTYVSFYARDLIKKSAIANIETSGYFDIDEIDLKEANADDSEKKELDKVEKKEYLGLRAILFNHLVFYNTEELKEDYVKQYDLWQDVQLTKVGHQYTSEGKGFTSGSNWYSSSRATDFYDEKKLCKLVVDEFLVKKTGDGFPITYNSSQFGYSYLPYHLYVKMYDITKHRDVTCHVSILDKYVYNKNLLSELIVDESIKTLINSLVDGEVQMEGKDIIEGKSGGLVILGYGPPGNGKTLTGEIYSEYVEKPLYQIQSSQLGVNVDDIEKKLSAVLRRAERWSCILMIDEADTYVYKRGQDMIQNAIVGTFLRLLEYYNGILFLTTNRKNIVDEAIMSRVTVAIPYNNPSKENLAKIWKTHIPAFGVNMPYPNIEEIVNAFPMSGRDVRNALKLLSKYYKNGEEIGVESINFIKEYLPSFEE